MRKAHLDFRGSFDKFVGAAIGIESDKSTGVSWGIYHAYAFVKFDKAINLQFGKMTNPLSLEGLQPSADLPFVEPSMVSNLAINKDIGAQVFGEIDHFFDYVFEIANGEQDNESSATGPLKATSDMKAFTERIFFTPFEKSDDPFLHEWFKGLGIGGGGSVDNETNEDTAVWSKLESSFGGNSFMTYNNVVPSGPFYHWDGQGYYYKDNFGFMGEYIQSVETVQYQKSSTTLPSVQLTNTAWLLEAQWVFGGKAGFEGAEVDNPFDLAEGHWGALELVARMHCNYIDVQSFTDGFPYSLQGPLGTGAQVAMAYGFGANWWFNNNFKFMCDFETTTFSGGNETFLPEDMFITRAALTL
jgi:phosphate-selective porin OprO/OprP